jgi:ribosomal protein S14
VSVIDKTMKERDEYKALYERVMVKLAALEELKEAENPEPKRHNYAPGHPRDAVTGRAVGRCVKCYRVGVTLIALGLCQACYSKRRRNLPRP